MFFFFSSRRRHTRSDRDWSSDVCSSDLMAVGQQVPRWIASQMGLTAEGLARSGAIAALTGTIDEMVEGLQRRREKLGISYIAVGDELMEGLAPVVERLAGR